MPFGPHHLGSRDPAHLARWQAALNAGHARMPRCTATTRLGHKCRHAAMRDADRCHWHLTGAARLAHGQTRIERLRRRSQLSDLGPRGREAARISLQNIERYRLLQTWKADPTIAGVAYRLNPHDEERVRAALLANFSVDLNAPLESTGRLPSPRLIHQLRRAMVLLLRQKTTRQITERKITKALRVEAKFFSKLKLFEPTRWT